MTGRYKAQCAEISRKLAEQLTRQARAADAAGIGVGDDDQDGRDRCGRLSGEIKFNTGKLK